MEDKRKQFNVADFVSNETTPVETKNGLKVFIHTTNRINDKSSFYQVVGEFLYEDNSWGLYRWSIEGKFGPTEDINRDLVFSEKKIRRMTNQELAWWIREHPEEHREWKTKLSFNVYVLFTYKEDEAQWICSEDILIRSNGGEWKEPLIEVEE